MLHRITSTLLPVLLAFVTLVGFGPGHRSTHETSPTQDRAAIIALKFHADWCGSCKAMGPVFTDLANKFDTEPVLFVTLDQTTQSSRRQALFLAQALGLDKVWAEDGGKTGFILLVNAKSMEVLARLTKDQDIKAMGGELTKALATVSGK